MIATVQLFLRAVATRACKFSLAEKSFCVAFDECQEIANSGENKGSFQNEFLELGDKLRPHCCQCQSDNSVCTCFAFRSVPMLLTSATGNLYVQKRCAEILHLGSLNQQSDCENNVSAQRNTKLIESNSKLVIFEKPAYRENLEYTVESRLAKNSKQDSKQAKERVKTILEDLPATDFAIVFCLKAKHSRFTL